MKPQIKFVYTTFSPPPPPPPPPYMLFGHLQGVPHLRCTGSFASPPSIVLVICKVPPPLHHIGHQHAPPFVSYWAIRKPPPLCVVLGHLEAPPPFASYWVIYKGTPFLHHIAVPLALYQNGELRYLQEITSLPTLPPLRG